MSYSKVELEGLKRKELFKLCKQTGVSTYNYSLKKLKKNVDVIEDLASYFEAIENDLKEMEDGLSLENLDMTFTLDESKEEEEEKTDLEEDNTDLEEDNMDFVEDNNELDEDDTEKDTANKNRIEEDNMTVEEDNKELKAEILREVEIRAKENLSKMPLFVADGVIIPTKSTVAAVKERNSYGVKVDSIDHYLEKKQKRAQEHLNFKCKLKENILPSKKMMRSSKSESALKKITEGDDKRKSVGNRRKINDEVTENILPKKKMMRSSKSESALKKITEDDNKRRSVGNKRKSVGNKRKTVVINDQVTVNTLPIIKSPKALRRASQRLRFSVINEESNSRVKPVIGPPKKSMLPAPAFGSARKSMLPGSTRKSLLPAPIIGSARKSMLPGTGVGSARKSMLPGSARKSMIPGSIQKAFGGLATPSFLKGPCTPKNKTPPPKFDLQASLKKPLRYTPHTGKLKETYTVNRKSIGEKEKCKEDRHVSVKELTKNNTRENRRTEANTKRGKNRDDMLDKRRGIEC